MPRKDTQETMAVIKYLFDHEGFLQTTTFIDAMIVARRYVEEHCASAEWWHAAAQKSS